ncbi:Tetratricopeptide repeat protein 21B [Clydaea vesicula]|uniref:Tetratricopeptide repeat protein 21B n=1 Tax=Clydaea vesicula TaxID=447962 RepID=A0AAD5U4Q8_9FUNG|nr:Tetratricopeptide repeat protein 21B [Clydaea vesicula]
MSLISAEEDLSTINYYLDLKYYNHCVLYCDGALNVKVGDPVLQFWKIFGVIMLQKGRQTEALRELQTLQEKRDLVLACPTAMIFIHERLQPVDYDAIEELQAKLVINSTSKNLSEKALITVALLHWRINQIDEAKTYFKQILSDVNANSSTARCFLGAVEAKNNKEYSFKSVLEANPRDLEGLMAKLEENKKKKKNESLCIDITSQIIVNNPNYVPAYIERMKLYLQSGNWELTLDAAQRLNGVSPNSIDALAVMTLHELCKEGDSKLATTYLSNLYDVIFITIMRVLEQCSRFLETALKLNPNKSECRSELAYVRLLQGNINVAKQLYEQSANEDADDIRSQEGLMHCQLLLGEYEHAEEHLDLFHHMSTNNSAKARIRFDYFIAVNPEYIAELLNDLSEFLPSTPRKDGEDIHQIIVLMLELVQLYCKIQPGSCNALYYLAKLKYLSNDQQSSQLHCSDCLKLDPTFLKAHILMAQIHLTNNHSKLATQSLEMGMSYNFEVRNIPMFHIIKAKALKMEGLYEEALNSLNFAISLPGIKESSESRSGNNTSLSERVSLYLECVEVHSKLNQTHEAAKIMEDTIRAFSTTEEEGRIIIANADLSIARGEIDLALQILSTITSSNNYFIEAKSRMADVYKIYKNDQRAYARCYSEMVDKNPSVKSWLLLGDAYMNIQEPQKAIAVYERALEVNPTAIVLAMKIGKALIKTHDYKKATQYYEHALTTPNSSLSLHCDLADLYRKLKQYDKAERTISKALDHPKSICIGKLIFKIFLGEDLTTDVKLYMLLAKVNEATNNFDKSINALIKARDMQIHILSRDSGQIENRENKVLASDICFQLAELLKKYLKDNEKGISYFNEALQFDTTSKKVVKALVALANLHMELNDLTSAQNVCATMLRMEVGVEEATIIMAEIMFKNNNYTAAIFHFQQLLEKSPNNYAALNKLIEMLKQSGNLDEAQKFFDMCEKGSEKCLLHPGYHFCKGLYYWYINNSNAALSEFNLSRKDGEWNIKATHNMIEIFLNPDNDTVGGDALESEEKPDEKTDSELLSLLTVEKLLKELPQKPPCLKTKTLEYYAIMGTKQKADIERALGKFMDFLNTERDYVPALLGTAVCHMLLKQPPRARNQLKRISKMDWTPEFAPEFEKSWLLLSDIYINGGKYDLATSLLKDVLKYNKSCAKAWEYLGYIMEKESSYKDAAIHYENAWKLQKQNNPVMGFKLAFNYLKAQRFVDAIDISQKVLSEYPEYPKIKKDILDKARSCLRMPIH